MYKYKLLIAYDGTSYGGWQIQPNTLTIQELIEKALSTLFRKKVTLVGSGRTDAGVHALEQAAHFVADIKISTDKLLYSLNGMLPKDIRILDASQVEESFHAQYSAIGKIYRYHLCINKTLLPFKRLYTWHIPYFLDIESMKETSKIFVGKQDFTSFANHAFEGSASRDAIREIYRIDFLMEEEILKVEFEGDGFLYKMVRNLLGTLVDVGASRIKKEDVIAIIEAKDRKKAGQAAPPHGLFLVKVHYSHGFEIKDIR